MPEAAAQTSLPAQVAAAGPAGGAKLDDLMLAMDVVDTLRHQEQLVARELGEDAREADLLERLRTIYRNQGIEVPDSVLQEGVKALKESRFTYEPPAPGFGTTLAKLWVNRGRTGAVLGLVVAAVVAFLAGRELLVNRPARLAAEAARTELTQTLPAALDAAKAAVLVEAKVDKARTQADQLYADGQAALKAGDPAAVRKAIADLDALRAALRGSYTLEIVSRPGERSGVFRVPGGNQNARNYYLIVEAIDPTGRPVPLPIRSEEDGKTQTVSKFGVRVPQATYDAVARDKQDDGIIQKARLGTKPRGALDIEYTMPVQGGFITSW
jgi:hypothetical protein